MSTLAQRGVSTFPLFSAEACVLAPLLCCGARLEPADFQTLAVPAVIKAFASPDRTVRSALLQKLPVPDTLPFFKSQPAISPDSVTTEQFRPRTNVVVLFPQTFAEHLTRDLVNKEVFPQVVSAYPFAQSTKAKKCQAAFKRRVFQEQRNNRFCRQLHLS